MSEHVNEQEKPIAERSGQPAVWDLVIEDMKARDQVGRARYGTPLQPFNGRKALVDAYQEMLDLAVYVRQELHEREILNAQLTAAIEEREAMQRRAEAAERDMAKAEAERACALTRAETAVRERGIAEAAMARMTDWLAATGNERDAARAEIEAELLAAKDRAVSLAQSLDEADRENQATEARLAAEREKVATEYRNLGRLRSAEAELARWDKLSNLAAAQLSRNIDERAKFECLSLAQVEDLTRMRGEVERKDEALQTAADAMGSVAGEVRVWLQNMGLLGQLDRAIQDVLEALGPVVQTSPLRVRASRLRDALLFALADLPHADDCHVRTAPTCVNPEHIQDCSGDDDPTCVQPTGIPCICWRKEAEEAVDESKDAHLCEQIRDLRDQLEGGPFGGGMEDRVRELEAENAELTKLLNTPEVIDFVKAVQLEAAHQRKRWPSDHDEGKSDADWFWLIGYLAGKALHNPGEAATFNHTRGDSVLTPCDACRAALEKQLHRIVTIAAAAANWHAAKLGQTNMRPGIEPPPAEENS